MTARIRKNESGMASLVIAILIVIIVSTLVLGFMQIIRREQRRSLDHQLSSQAYYAAESGVNDAIKAIKQEGFTGDKTTCGPLANPPSLASGTNVLSSDAQYSCLLINQSPTSIQYDKVSTSHSNVFPISSATGMSKVTFTWQNPDNNVSSTRGPNVGPNSTLFPPMTLAGNWDSLGLLRVDLVSASSLDRASLIGGARTYFMYPNRSGGPPGPTINYPGTPSGTIIDGNCSGAGNPGISHTCSVTVNIPGGLPGPFYARIIAMYAPVKVSVKGSDSAGAAAHFAGAQAVIDSTGKAADVLRRIQVRVPPSDIDVPDYAIATMDSLCKKFTAQADGTLQVDPSAPDAGLATSPCNPN